MTNVASAIASLLYDHDTVIVPGLGAFVRHDRSAHVNVITNEFQRPSAQLDFDSRQREENALVIEALMASDGLTNDEARTTVATFVNDCFAQLKADGTVTLPGIGTLTLNEHQDLAFEPDDTNFNGDAFGLEDLTPEPVYKVGSEELGVRSEELGVSQEEGLIESIQPTQPTQPTQPNPHRSLWWLWLLLLLLAAGGVALWYFEFRPVPTKPWPVPSLQRPERPHLLPTMPADTLPTDTIPADTLLTPDTPEPIQPTEPTQPTELIQPTEPTEPAKPTPISVITPEPTSKAFIVGGCFSVEQNALNMTTEARDQGCAEAFVMKRGSKYFVCYGQYATSADAKAALLEVLAKYNAKAWILTK